MSTYNAFYVKKQGDGEAARAAILQLFPDAMIVLPGEYMGGVLSVDDSDVPEQELADVSAKQETDIIWVTYQTTAESFIFHHWRNGSKLRSLWYGCTNEGTWDRVEGEAEPWEAEEFWSDDALEGAIECAESDADRKKLEALWKDKILSKGQTDPTIGSQSAVHAVMVHYGLFEDEAAQSIREASGQVNPPRRKKKGGCILFLLLFIAFWIFVVNRLTNIFR